MAKTEDLIAEIEEMTKNTEDNSDNNSLSNPSEKKDLKNLNSSEEYPKDTWGGKRPGAGCPEGKKQERTVRKEEAERYFKDRVIRSVGKLVDSQMNLARGCQFLMKIQKEFDKNTKCWKTPKNAKPVIVKDKQEIMDYLAGEFDTKESIAYYFMTTERPDNRALDSLLDRTFGRATQNVKGELNLTMNDLLKQIED